MKRTHISHINVDENGKGFIQNRHMLEEFFQMHPNTFIEAKFKVVTKPHSSNTMRYFWAEVVPKLRAGFKQTGHDFDLDTTEDYVKQFSPVMYEEVEFNGNLTRRYKSIKELSQEEFGEHIENMKRLAAEEFSILINDPI